jgi:hypothetical protein
MTRSEEHVNVGTRSEETGRARLRKYVVTEEETRTIPVRKEKAVIEREPITDANRDEALDGPDISEEDHLLGHDVLPSRAQHADRDCGGRGRPRPLIPKVQDIPELARARREGRWGSKTPRRRRHEEPGGSRRARCGDTHIGGHWSPLEHPEPARST